MMESEPMMVDLDLENICRVCLTQHERLVSLFTTQIVAGCITRMSKMVQYCLDITVDEHDILSKKICETCRTTVISFFTFKERCKRTEKLLLESLQKVQPPPSIIPTASNRQNEVEIKTTTTVPKTENRTKKQELPLLQTDTHIENDLANINEPPHQIPTTETQPASSFVDTILSENMAKVDEETITEEELIVETNDPNTYAIIYEVTAGAGIKEEIEEQVQIQDSNDSESRADEEDHHDRHEDDEETLAEVDEFLCETCQKVFPRDEFIEHCRINHYLCEDCFISFETEAELQDHQTVDHKFEGSVRFVENRKLANNSLLCQICNKRQSTKEQLNQHVKMHEALNISMTDKFECYECRQCHTVYLKSEELNSHMSLHGGEGVQPDDDCTDYQFLEDEKAATPYTCGFCKVTYASMDVMRCHIIIHLDSFSCPFDLCGCEYDTFSRLSLHIMKKHVYGEENLCTHCRVEQFATFDELQQHIKNDCIAKKFECSHCDKKFFSRKALSLHLKHVGDKKYQCMQCSKTFAQHGELTIHYRTHTGEKPFKCTICSRAYRTASMRAAHMDAHIDGKTFECNVCSKMLQTRTSYRNHMKRHTAGKSHTCGQCGKSFYTKYHLDLHTSKVHNKVKES